jgi:hypothetical protein
MMNGTFITLILHLTDDLTLFILVSRKLITWVTFQKSGNIVNLSRVNPGELAVSSMGSQRYLILPGTTHHYMVAVSLVHIHECCLITPKASGQSYVKKVGAL